MKSFEAPASEKPDEPTDFHVREGVVTGKSRRAMLQSEFGHAVPGAGATGTATIPPAARRVVCHNRSNSRVREPWAYLCGAVPRHQCRLATAWGGSLPLPEASWPPAVPSGCARGAAAALDQTRVWRSLSIVPLSDQPGGWNLHASVAG